MNHIEDLNGQVYINDQKKRVLKDIKLADATDQLFRAHNPLGSMTVRKMDQDKFTDSYLETHDPNEIYVQIKTTGNVTKVTYHDQKFNSVGVIQKLDKDHYMDKRTGEVYEYQNRSSNRSQNAKSIQRSIAALRDLINANVTDGRKCKWLTLTYAENMTDRERLYFDYNRFMIRLKRYCKKNDLPEFEYICVVEPQERGAWHCHVILIFKDNAPFIHNDVIHDLWEQGFTKTKSLPDCDNIGAYLSAYLSDLPMEDDQGHINDDAVKIMTDNNLGAVWKEFADDQGNLKRKRFIKGARLYLYPPGMNLYRSSRGLIKPKIEDMTYIKALENEKIPDRDSETFSSAYALVDSQGTHHSTLSIRYYNSKRSKKT